MATKFKYDPYCGDLTKGQKTIAKSIWLAGMAEPDIGEDRYKVPKEVEEIVGKIRYWDHEADSVISTNPGNYGKLITLGDPYVLISIEH